MVKLRANDHINSGGNSNTSSKYQAKIRTATVRQDEVEYGNEDRESSKHVVTLLWKEDMSKHAEVYQEKIRSLIWSIKDALKSLNTRVSDAMIDRRGSTKRPVAYRVREAKVQEDSLADYTYQYS